MKVTEKKIVNTDHILDRIKEILTPTICEEVGVMPISINEAKICIGAMNPEYKKVKLLSQKINSSFGIPVELEQITPIQWERWFESGNINPNILTEISSDRNSQINKSYALKADSNIKTIDENKNISEEKSFDDKESDDNQRILIQSENHAEDEISIDEDERVTMLDHIIDESEEEDFSKDIDLLDNDLMLSKDPLIAGVASILNKCLLLKASDIHVESLEDKLRIRYRIDGMLKEFYSLNKSLISPVISRIKIMGGLDIAEKRLPQDGRIRCLLSNRNCDFRVSTLPGKWGEKVVLRALESDTSILDLDKLVDSNLALNSIREMGHSPYGIVIVVGPTGSGKSTTLYSILNELNTDRVNISTVEDPVEYTLHGIHQVQVIREKGLDFAKALRSLMRQDPDIILVGETRDKETAQTAMEAALTGHMVFTTLHANDTSTAITRLSEMGIPAYLIGASVIGVIAQRLVRRVCPECSTIRNLDPLKDKLAMSYEISKARVPKVLVGGGNQINNKHLCSNCGGSGYKGRVGIYEIMRINDQLRELIMTGSTADVLRNKAQQLGYHNLLKYGMDLVKNQITTIEEVERVCLLDGEL